MNTETVQRWNGKRSSYRPAGEPINTLAYEVVELAKKGGPAADFVREHHYSGSVPSARRQFGLYRRNGGMVGAAIFSVPTNVHSLSSVPIPRWLLLQHCLDLGRFVLLDDVPANGETWFLGRCFELLKQEGFAGVVSFADPVRRTRVDGSEVMPGHIGRIYRAHNAIFTGLSKARVHQLLPDGTILSPRTLQKARAGEMGQHRAVALLTNFGAPAPGRFEPVERWLQTWLAVIARPLPHIGCLRYVWSFHRLLKRKMGSGLPYPTWEGLGLQRRSSARPPDEEKNQRDRGRSVLGQGGPNRRARRLLANQHPQRRLRAEQLPEIRRRIAAGERHADIAASYCVSRSTITAIAQGKNWSAA